MNGKKQIPRAVSVRVYMHDQCYEDYFVLETLYILNVAEKAGVDIDLQEAEKGIRGTSGKIRTTLCSFSH